MSPKPFDPTPFVDVLRAELVQRRQRLGWLQKDVADRIGCDQGVLSSWERGTRVPLLSGFVAWAAALGFDVGLIPIPREDGEQ